MIERVFVQSSAEGASVIEHPPTPGHERSAEAALGDAPRHLAYIDPRPLLGSFQSELYFPRYRVVERGAWAIRAIAMLGARGYWGEVYRIEGALIMVGPSEAGTQSWMSMLPSEIESQEIGLRASHGHTVICGLGMGWLAANIALRPEVTRVSVIERDADVIALVRATEVFEPLPKEARGKITVHHADALAWRPDAPVDTLQADIWRRLVEPGKLAAVRRMQTNIAARSIYFWGQELEIWRYACRRAQGVPSVLGARSIQAIVAEDLQLPLIVRDADDYGRQIAGAAQSWTPAEDGWWREP